MKLRLSPEVERMIEQCIESGQYASAEEVINTAVLRFAEDQIITSHSPDQLNRIIEEAKNSGPLIPLEKVKEKLKNLESGYKAESA